MLMDSNSLIPQCLHSSLLISVLHFGDDSLDITSFHSNGFLYEFKDKKIVGNIHIGLERIDSLSVYYLTEDNILIRYYLVFVEGKTLLIIKKKKTLLTISKVYEKVKEFTVFDFMSLGYPQLKIDFHNAVENGIFDFSGLKLHKSHLILENGSERSSISTNFTITSYLSEKLQMMNRFIDNLKEEEALIKKTIRSPVKNMPNDEFPGCLAEGKIKFSYKNKCQPSMKITVLNVWQHIYETYFVCGMRILNSDDKPLSNIKVQLSEGNVTEFRYAFFSMPDESEKSLRMPSNIKPGCEFLVICALKMPKFIHSNIISLDCFLSTVHGDTVKIGTINLDAFTIWNRPKAITSTDDVLLMMTLLKDISFVMGIEMEDVCHLKDALKKLGFDRLFGKGSLSLFYSPLNKVGVILDRIKDFSPVWKFQILTSDCVRLYLFLNAFYDALPENIPVVHHLNLNAV